MEIVKTIDGHFCKVKNQLIDYSKQTVTIGDPDNPTFTIALGHIGIVDFSRLLEGEGWDGILSENPSLEEIEAEGGGIYKGYWKPYVRKNGEWGWQLCNKGDKKATPVTVMVW